MSPTHVTNSVRINVEFEFHILLDPMKTRIFSPVFRRMQSWCATIDWNIRCMEIAWKILGRKSFHQCLPVVSNQQNNFFQPLSSVRNLKSQAVRLSIQNYTRVYCKNKKYEIPSHYCKFLILVLIYTLYISNIGAALFERYFVYRNSKTK